MGLFLEKIKSNDGDDYIIKSYENNYKTSKLV